MSKQPTDTGEYALNDTTYIPAVNDKVYFYTSYSHKGRQYDAEMHIGASILPKESSFDTMYEHEDYTLGSSGYKWRRWNGIYGSYGSFGYESNTPNNSKVEIGTDVSYGRGIRIYAGSSVHSGIMLGGSDLTSNTGTSANSWYITNESGGLFKLYKNTTAKLSCDTDGNWTMDGSLTNSSGFIGNLTGNAATATDSESVKVWYSTSNANRPLMMVDDTAVSDTSHKQEQGVYCGSFYANPSTGVLTSVSGFSSTGSYTTSLTTSTHLAGNKGTAIINSTAAKGYTMLARMKSTNGVFTHGVYNGDYQFYYTADSLISAGTNNVTKTCLRLNENGIVYAPNGFDGALTGNVTGNCSGSSGSCTGNAATATTATNANNAKLTHTVGNTEYPLVFGSSFIITDAQQALRIGTPSATANQCPLRVKAYCAAANTQGESYIVIGNQLAKASANNSRGGLYLYGTGTAWAKFQAGDQTANKTVTLVAPADVTLTLPSATGTLALTSSNITGSSASCTGNAATATTASACSGNAASATYATNIRVTDTDSNTWYPLVFSTGSAASTNYAARVDADSILVYPGVSPAAGKQGYCYLQLGNNKTTAAAANKRGVLRIYGTGTAYTEITSATVATARSISFPDKAGTVALTSDIPTIPAFNNIYTGFGVLVKSDENKITGYGHATVTYVGTNKVRIECTIRITANTSTTNYALYGISAAQIKSVTGFPSNITPISYAGYWDCPSITGNNLSVFGGGSTFVSQSSNKYWHFGRYYTTAGAFGGWPAHIWIPSTIDANGGTVLHCVCYGSI